MNNSPTNDRQYWKEKMASIKIICKYKILDLETGKLIFKQLFLSVMCFHLTLQA